MRRLNLMVTMVAVAVTGALSLNPAAAQAAPAKPHPAGAAVTRGGAGLNARAAAGLVNRPNFAAGSWFSGTVAAGGQQHWIWNNAGTNIAYRVGFSPTGASTTAPCQFEAVDQWYEGLNTGERKFHFVLENVGSVDCGATIELSAVSATATRSTGGLNPGDQATFHESNVDENSAFLVGLVPSGATANTSCQFKVVATWYDKEHRGDVATPTNLYYTVENVGAITCVASVEVGSNPVERVLPARTLRPGAQAGLTWNNANPTTAVHLIGMLLSDTGCEMQITRSRYLQVINSNGTVERKLQFWFKNVGTITCTGQPTLSRI